VGELETAAAGGGGVGIWGSLGVARGRWGSLGVGSVGRKGSMGVGPGVR
jgi:hypothetical protein